MTAPADPAAAVDLPRKGAPEAAPAGAAGARPVPAEARPGDAAAEGRAAAAPDETAPASAAASAAPAAAPASSAASAPAAAPAAPVELLVCVKCRRGAELPADARRPGQRLFDEITAEALPAGVTVTAVDCLQNCEAGCTVALRGGSRWTYVFGNLDERTQSAMLREGAALYRDTADGLIPWRQRPEHFKRNCVARIPPPTPSQTPES
jgi:predicted metal-binding protein